MRVVVTGGAGFIGSHLVDELVKLGHDVVVVDDFSSGDAKNLAGCIKKIDVVKGDILSLDLVKVFSGAGVVFHLAAACSVAESMINPDKFNRINIEGTFRVLDSALKAGVGRVVNSSSSAVYGDSKDVPSTESSSGKMLSPYAISKFASEEYCRFFSLAKGLDTVSLRYFNVFGSRQKATSAYAAVIPRFVDLMKNNKQPVIFGDGTQSRDFTHVSNVVSANILAAFAKSKFNGLSINIGSGNSTSINELVSAINSLLGSSIKPKYVDVRDGDIVHSCADISFAKKLLGFKVLVNFIDGLKDTLGL